MGTRIAGLLAAAGSLLGAVAPAAAQFEAATLFGPLPGPPDARVEYRLTAHPERPVEGQGASLGLLQHDLALTLPAWQTPRDEVTVGLGARLHDVDTNAVLPDSGERFPGELWDLRLGAGYRHRFDGGWVAGAALSVGSASDQPFAGPDAITLQVTGLVRVPSGERNAWLFLLNYSNNRDFLNHVPIPGVGYWWEPSDRLRVLVGVPFALVQARPHDDLQLALSYFPLRTVRARATYRVLPPLRLFVGFDWDNQRFLRADRPDADDRLFYYEKRVTGGVIVSPRRDVTLELGAGYAFDRFYFEGESYDDRDRNRLDVGAGAVVSLRLELRF